MACSVDDIAVSLGKSKGAIYKQLERGVVKLRETPALSAYQTLNPSQALGGVALIAVLEQVTLPSMPASIVISLKSLIASTAGTTGAASTVGGVTWMAYGASMLNVYTVAALFVTLSAVVLWPQLTVSESGPLSPMPPTVGMLPAVVDISELTNPANPDDPQGKFWADIMVTPGAYAHKVFEKDLRKKGLRVMYMQGRIRINELMVPPIMRFKPVDVYAFVEGVAAHYVLKAHWIEK